MIEKKNYQRVLEDLIEKIKDSQEVPTLMLHSCCGPCSTSVLEYLSQYFKITIDFYNPNIYPSKERVYRGEVQKKLVEQLKTIHPIQLWIPPQDIREFGPISLLRQATGEGKEGCHACYRFRMLQAAREAKKRGMDYFSTTLSVSPHKNAQVINQIGEEIANEIGIAWLYSDFKKKNGYKRSIELSKEYDLYRQDYCGCIFSYQESLKRKEDMLMGKEK